VGISCFSCGDDHYAVVRFILKVQKPQQGDCEFGTVGCRTAEKVRGTAVVIAAVPQVEPSAADTVGGSDPGQDSKTSRNVKILVSVAFVKDECGDVKVSAGGPQPTPRFGDSTLHCAC
jgi:hypothetical protein